MIGALSNHLWQSTIFAVAAGLLTFVFRNNRAFVRYWLWFAASAKFLFPFSFLIALAPGGADDRLLSSATFSPRISSTIVQIAVPFPAAEIVAPAPYHDWIPWAVALIWACGFLTIASLRLRAWLRIRAAVRASTPADIPAPVEVRFSPGLLEPGVVGVFRPVVLLPSGITSRLTPLQLDAVLAHEFCHARRRDNLTAALHMLVEALFWFHPLVWWIGARLIEERERACDQAVLALGNEPRAYAESILTVCKSYLESPLACVSGVTGSDLKKRIHTILTDAIPRDLNLAKKSILAAAGLIALSAPVLIGTIHVRAAHAQSTAPANPKFEVASVKPSLPDAKPSTNFPLGPGDVYVRNGGLFSATAVPLVTYILFAYKLIGNQAQFLTPQLPDWAKSEPYDIQARANGDPGKDQMRLMMRSLLADRFKLALHYEPRDIPVMAFVLTKNRKLGPQLQPHPENPPCPTEQPSLTTPAVKDGVPVFCNGIYQVPSSIPGRLRFAGRNVALGFIADTFSAGGVGRPIIDQTGLTGKFDFTIEFVPDRSLVTPQAGPPGAEPPPDPSGPSFAEALQDQLGIKLQSEKHSMDVLVLDHVERPSPN